MKGRTEIFSWFDAYAEGFKHNDPAHDRNFVLKAQHCRKVAAECAAIAQHSSWPDDDIIAAEIAGLLHDVGRFEQYHRYRTFLDRNSTNHAVLAVEEIDTFKVLEVLPQRWRDPVRAAVRWHNARTVPAEVTGIDRRVADVVRDADKLDIFRVVIGYYNDRERDRNETLELDAVDSPDISSEIAADILAGKTGDYRHLKTSADFRVLVMAWVYDMNTPWALSEIAKRRYLEDLYATMTPTAELDAIYTRIRAYLLQK